VQKRNLLPVVTVTLPPQAATVAAAAVAAVEVAVQVAVQAAVQAAAVAVAVAVQVAVQAAAVQAAVAETVLHHRSNDLENIAEEWKRRGVVTGARAEAAPLLGVVGIKEIAFRRIEGIANAMKLMTSPRLPRSYPPTA
jgi:hypothetical protein